MKAIMKVAAGVGNVEVRDIPEPDIKDGLVKIRVEAAGLCGTDLHIFKDEFRSWPPVVLGHEVAGEVVEVGAGVSGIEPGFRVTTETYFYTCGQCRYCRAGQNNLCLNRRSIGSGVNGGFTNYVVVPAKNIHRLPENVDFEAGALTEPLACVVHAVTTTPTVTPGDMAVIAGPGAIGLLALQVVKAAGATVIMLGTDKDDHRLALATQLGADYTLNVQQEDPKALVENLTEGGFGADVVYECSGAGPAAAQLLTLVRRKGRYVQIGLLGKPVAWDLDQLCYKELIATGSNASIPSAWKRAIQLMESGLVKTAPLITHQFPVTDWEQAFATFDDRAGVKALIKPV
jgi:L-iditol 2-dehydrogenase